jgi:hypothetical protein
LDDLHLLLQRGESRRANTVQISIERHERWKIRHRIERQSAGLQSSGFPDSEPDDLVFFAADFFFEVFFSEVFCEVLSAAESPLSATTVGSEAVARGGGTGMGCAGPGASLGSEIGVCIVFVDRSSCTAVFCECADPTSSRNPEATASAFPFMAAPPQEIPQSLP